MSKFCEKCGAEMNEDDKNTICSKCAASKETVKKETAKKEELEKKVEAAKVETAKTTTTQKVEKKDNKNFIYIGIGIVAVVVILVAILANVLGKGYEAPIKNLFKGMQTANVDTYLKAFPEFMGMADYIDEDDMKDQLESLEEEYGDNIKISYKIIDKEKIEKEDLEEVQDSISTYYDKDVKVSAGYKLTVKSTIKGKDDSDTDTSTMKVYKIDGKWCLMSF